MFDCDSESLWSTESRNWNQRLKCTSFHTSMRASKVVENKWKGVDGDGETATKVSLLETRSCDHLP
jgi:hypothetical protein